MHAQLRADYFVAADSTGMAITRIRNPHPHDVLAGRGGGINSHPGNCAFREWVKQRKNDYNLASSKQEKAVVAHQVISKVRNQSPPGRFLMRDQRGSFWLELDDGKIFAKTSQALREGAPSIRAQHKGEENAKRSVIATGTTANANTNAKTNFSIALPKPLCSSNPTNLPIAPTSISTTINMTTSCLPPATGQIQHPQADPLLMQLRQAAGEAGLESVAAAQGAHGSQSRKRAEPEDSVATTQNTTFRPLMSNTHFAETYGQHSETCAPPAKIQKTAEATKIADNLETPPLRPTTPSADPTQLDLANAPLNENLWPLAEPREVLNVEFVNPFDNEEEFLQNFPWNKSDFRNLSNRSLVNLVDV